MQHRLRQTLVSFLCLLTLLSQGWDVEAQATGPRPGRRWIVWLDLSSSVLDAQRASWLQALQYIVSQLSADDSIYVFGIHESTLAAAPLYTGYIPVLSPQAGLSERLRVNGARQKVREEATEAIKQALSGKANAKQTDIFGAVDRIHPDEKGRHTLLYFFSDMEHVTSELNMEVVPLGKNMPGIIQRVVTRHGWHSHRLENTVVYCVLPGIRGGSRVNNRLVLAQFWGDLLRALGAELKHFEAYLQTS